MKKLVAAIPMLPDASGFAVPVFEDNKCFYVQSTDDEWMIKSFDRINGVPDYAISFENDEPIEVDEGSESVHVFRLPTEEIILGERSRFSTLLGKHIGELEEYPVGEEANDFFDNESYILSLKRSRQPQGFDLTKTRRFLGRCKAAHLLTEG